MLESSPNPDNPIAHRSRDRKGVPHGPQRATKGDEDAVSARSNGIRSLDRVFRGASPLSGRHITRSET
jgi:hypothetical protein